MSIAQTAGGVTVYVAMMKTLQTIQSAAKTGPLATVSQKGAKYSTRYSAATRFKVFWIPKDDFVSNLLLSSEGERIVKIV